MSDEEFDPFALSTGLADKFEGAITDPFFSFKPDYNNGETLLFQFDVNTGDSEIGDGGVVSLQYSCGNGWEAGNKGAIAQREDGKKKGFNQNSAMGQLIAAAMECAGDELRARAKNIKEGPMSAALWDGLNFAWERKDFHTSINNEDVKYNRMLPVKLLDGSAKAAPASSAPAKEAPAEEEAPTASNGSTGTGIDNGTLAKIKVRAKKAENHDEFMVLCYDEIPDLSAEAEALITDEAQYAALKG